MAEDTKKSAAEEAAETAPEEALNESAEGETEEETPAVAVETVLTDETDKLKTGQVVRVHLKIKETTPKGEERERIQVYEGTIIAKKGRSRDSATITVRKVSKGFGVERIFPLRMPTIAKIELVKELQTRRSKLYYTRDRRSRKLKEAKPKGVAAKPAAKKAVKK